MSKRVQYAQSLPVLSANPTAEAGRTVFYALSDGLYARLETGVILGPFGAGGGAAVVGGAIPASRTALPTPSSVQMGADGLAGTFEDVPGLSTSVTTAAAVPLFVLSNLAVSTVTGNSAVEVGVRVVVDSVPEQQGNATRVIIPRAAELNATSASMLTAALPAGTYTARVQWRRVTGTLIPEITTGSTFLQAQQAPKGEKGDPGTGGGLTGSYLPVAPDGRTEVLHFAQPTTPAVGDLWIDPADTAPAVAGGGASSASIITVPFFFAGFVNAGVKTPRFIVPVAMTLKGGWGRVSTAAPSTSTFTWRALATANGGATTVTATSPATDFISLEHDFTDIALAAGDTLRVELVTAPADGQDYCITLHGVAT